MSWWATIDAPTGVLAIIGCGSREWLASGAVSGTLEPLRAQYPMLTVIEGGQRGADTCVAQWASGARSRGVHWVHLPARWNDYEHHDRWRAGHDRNQVMLDQLLEIRDFGHGVAVVAFKHALDPALHANPKAAKGGTEDMIRRAWGADVATFLVRTGGRPPRQLLPAAIPMF